MTTTIRKMFVGFFVAAILGFGLLFAQQVSAAVRTGIAKQTADTSRPEAASKSAKSTTTPKLKLKTLPSPPPKNTSKTAPAAVPPHPPELPLWLRSYIYDQIYDQAYWKLVDEYPDVAKLEKLPELRKKYLGTFTNLKELEQAIKQTAAAIGDRYTRYFTSDEIAANKKSKDDGAVSLGLLLSQNTDGTWQVDFVVGGSDAYLKDIRRGDIIKSIAGKKLKGLKLNQFKDLFYNKVGKTAEVVFRHDGTDEKVQLVFKEIKQKVEWKILSGDILYIKLPGFDEDSHQQVKDAVSTMLRNKQTFKGIVLDLRNNPGGQLDIAFQLSNMFMEKGSVVKTIRRSNNEGTETNYFISPTIFDKQNNARLLQFRQAPMVVLTNACSASASEILTGALKDNKRATIVGESTYGKDVGYTQYKLGFANINPGGILRITVLVYQTPKGFDPKIGRGIKPDHVVVQPRRSAQDVQLLAAHLRLALHVLKTK